MADTSKVAVEFAHPHDGHNVDARVEYPAAEAKQLIRAGIARPATVPDATVVNVDPDLASTKRKA